MKIFLMSFSSILTPIVVDIKDSMAMKTGKRGAKLFSEQVRTQY
jgi:hypothetical protein